MGDDKNIRHRFTVPKDDDLVEEWIQAQSNLGFSLRVLIRAFVRSYGVRDATCMELGMAVKKVGRPPKQAQIALGGMLGDDAGPGLELAQAGGLVPERAAAEEPEVAPPPARVEPVAGPAAAQGGSPIDEMFGTKPPTRAQESLMDGIMHLDT